jgi:hypothetical protein
MFIPDPESELSPSRIPDPHQRIYFIYFNPNEKWFLSSRKYDTGFHPGSRIRMLTFYPSRIPDPGVKKSPDPGFGSATLILTVHRETLTQYITFKTGGQGEPVLMYSVVLQPVFRIRIHRIHVFFGLPDPDPLVRGMYPDPDPSIIMQK